MNKRRYTVPMLQIVNIAQQTHILAGSPGIGISEGPAGKDYEVLSRQDDGFWDDEE